MSARICAAGAPAAAAAALVTLGAVLFNISAVSQPKRADRGSRRPRRPRRRRLYRRAARCSASTTSATRRSGAARCSCTRRSRARSSGVSDPGVSAEDGARGRPEGRRHERCRRRCVKASRGQGRPRPPRRRRWRCSSSTRSSASRASSTARDAPLGGHHLRGVPLDRQQLVRAGHRAAARRVGQPRPQRRRHRHLAPAGRLQPVADMLDVDEATVRKVLQAGARASSTPSCSSTGRASSRTGARQRR